MAWTQNPAGALPFRMGSRRSFLRLCLVAEVSQWLGHDFIVFRGSKRNVSRFWGCTPAMAWTQNLLGICLVGCAPDASFLGFDIPCQKFGRRNLHEKKIKTFLAKSLWQFLYQETLWREIYAKQFSAVIPTEKVLDESFLPQTPWREIFTKQFSKETPTKKYFGKTSTKQIFTEKSLPKPCPMISLLQTICK